MKRVTTILTAMLVALLMSGSWSWAAEQECSTETTGWVLESPGKNWVQTDEKTVTDKEAVADSYTDWVNEGEPTATPGVDTDTVRWVVDTVAADGYWDDTNLTFYTWTGGPEPVIPPVYSDDTETALHPDWNATSGKPKGKPHRDAEIRVPYNVSNGDVGLGSWFLKSGVYVPAQEASWQKQVRTFVPGSDAVTHQEFKFEKTVCVDKPDKPEEPKNDKPDEPKTDKPDEPKQPELAATGANMAGLGIGAALVAAGSMLMFAKRRLTSI